MDHILRYGKKVIVYILNNEWSLLYYKIRKYLFPLILYFRYFRRLILRENFSIKHLQEKEKLLTIVIFNFTSREDILNSVKSLANQTLIPDEIIIVLNTKKEHVFKKLSKLSYIKFLSLPQTESIYTKKILEQALSLINNRYVCCLKAGDTLVPTYLEKAIFLLETYRYDIALEPYIPFALKYSSKNCSSYKISAPFHITEALTTIKMLNSPTIGQAILYRRESCLQFLRNAPSVKSGNMLPPELVLSACGARVSVLREVNIVRGHDAAYSRMQKVENTRYSGQVLSYTLAKSLNTILQLSARNNAKMFRCLSPGGALAYAQFRQHTFKAQVKKPTLLLCLGIITPGGAVRLTTNILTYLINHGWHCIIISTDDYLTKNLEPVLEYRKISSEVYELKNFLLDPEQRSDFLLYLLQSRCVDIILQSGSELLYTTLFQIYKLKNRPIIVDLLFNTKGHTKNNRRYSRYIDHIIIENKEVMSWLIEHGEKVEKITSIASGITVPPLTPSRLQEQNYLRESLGITPGHMVFGYSGRLSSEKNPLAFIDLAVRCQDLPYVHFIMTGGGPLSNTIMERIAAQTLPRLHFMGFVQDPYLYMSIYNMLVLPSILDGRPLAIMEAMAMGIPCLATNIGGLPELIQDGKTGILIPPQNLDALDQAVRQMAAHPQSLHKMGIAAATYAAKHFDIKSMCQNYEKTLSNVLHIYSKSKNSI